MQGIPGNKEMLVLGVTESTGTASYTMTENQDAVRTRWRTFRNIFIAAPSSPGFARPSKATLVTIFILPDAPPDVTVGV